MDANQENEIMRIAAPIFSKSHKKIVRELANADADIVSAEMDRTIATIGVKSFVEEGFLPYAAVSVILAFSGREITEKNIVRMIKALDLKPDKEMLKKMKALNYKNHLLYVNSLYLLLAIRRRPTEKEIMKLVAAMGIAPDAELAKHAIGLYKYSGGII